MRASEQVDTAIAALAEAGIQAPALVALAGYIVEREN